MWVKEISFLLLQVQTLGGTGLHTMLRTTWLCIILVAFVSRPVWLQKPHKRKTQLKAASCCEEMRELKVQVANLSSLLGELSRKQESDWVSVVMQVMELESSGKHMESRLTTAESKYSEMNNQIGIMQLQAAQTVTQTSAGKCGPHTLHHAPAEGLLAPALLLDNLLNTASGALGLYSL